MLTDTPCPICDHEEWTEIGSRCYDRQLLETQDEYLRRRFEVLFNLWFPKQPSITLKSLVCHHCGFVLYTPRPNDKNLDEKYEYLCGLVPLECEANRDQSREKKRALRLWRKLRRNLRPGMKVLDYGGGDGRLMRPFVAHGLYCTVVDYNERVEPTVRHLAHKIEDVPDDEKFDCIVCSHVLEHVAQPRRVMKDLRNHLAETGLIYVEVPMEIWRKAPLYEEPVTHVNFFTVESLRALLDLAGLRPQYVNMEGYAHPSGHRTVVITALAAKSDHVRESIAQNGLRAVQRLLHPNLQLRLQRALLHPAALPRAIQYRVRSFCRSEQAKKTGTGAQ